MKPTTKAFLKKHQKKLVTALITAIIVLAVIIMFAAGEISSAKAMRERDFSAAFALYNDKKLAGPNVGATTWGIDAVSGDKEVLTAGYDKPVVRLVGNEEVDITGNTSATFNFDVHETGLYYIELEYTILGDIQSEHICTINPNNTDINDLADDYKHIMLPVYWTYDDKPFETNRQGNDVLPMQHTVDGFMVTYAREIGHKNELGLPFNFTKGANTVTISIPKGEVLFAGIKIISASNTKSYNEYKNANASKKAATGKAVVQGERFAYKDNIAIQPSAIRNINVYPYHTFELRLNAVSAHESGNRITYSFEAPTDGMYKIAFNYEANKANTTVFRTIYIDNQVPFGELMHYPFGYTKDYTYHNLGRAGNDFEFYFTAGTHTITIEIDGVIMNDLTAPLKAVSKRLSTTYLDIKKLVGPTPDKNRDWVVFDYFPDIVEDFNDIKSVIEQQKRLYMDINGSEVESGAVVNMNSALRVLNNLLKEPNRIPNNVKNISEGTDSVVQNISKAVLEIESSAMAVDAIYITGTNDKSDYKHKGGFIKFGDSIKSFFGSFFRKLTVEKSDNTIEIWMNRALNNVNIVQNMVESDFMKKHDIKVNVSMLKDEGKLVLTNASGINPDGVIGVSTFMPYEMGLRGLIADLNQFDDIREVAKQFAPGAMIPYMMDDKVLGIPETADAQMIYYRKDILNRLGLTIDDFNTWEGVIKALPILQRNGMNFFAPLSAAGAAKALGATAPFIYQHGGSLYGADGMSTAVDEDEAVKGIKLMTDLYTVYGLPLETASFPESFRDGTLPIGMSGLGLYSQLLVSAPELVGLWDMAPAPGVYNEEIDDVVRWNSGTGSSCAIMAKSDKQAMTWEFMKWWMSTEVQINYAVQVRSIWGNQFIWASANQDAFKSSVFSREHKNHIYEQWRWLMEIPRLPGWYMIERELSNAWNYVVFDGNNLRYQLDVVTVTSNREIIRKMTEYGYLDKNGNKLKDFKITTVKDIEDWLEGK